MHSLGIALFVVFDLLNGNGSVVLIERSVHLTIGSANQLLSFSHTLLQLVLEKNSRLCY